MAGGIRWLARENCFSVAAPGARGRTSSGQSTAVNGSIEGTIKDASGGLLPGVTVTVHNNDTGAERVVVTDANGHVSRDAAAARHLPRHGRTRRVQEAPADRHPPQRRGRRRSSTWSMAVGALTEVVSSRPMSAVVDLGKIDVGPQPQRSRNPEPAARLAQPVQFRAPAAGRQRVREFGVRRAALQCERLAAADQLPDRRQYQHAEGSRGAPTDADVGSRDRRSEGHDERVRAGIRPDDGARVQRHHPVGHQPAEAATSATGSADRVQRLSVLLHPAADPREQASGRGEHGPATWAGPIVKRQGALLRRLRTDLPGHGRAITWIRRWCRRSACRRSRLWRRRTRTSASSSASSTTGSAARTG